MRDLDMDALAAALVGEGAGPVTGDERRAEVTNLIHAKAKRLMEATGCTRTEAISQIINRQTS